VVSWLLFRSTKAFGFECLFTNWVGIEISQGAPAGKVTIHAMYHNDNDAKATACFQNFKLLLFHVVIVSSLTLRFSPLSASLSHKRWPATPAQVFKCPQCGDAGGVVDDELGVAYLCLMCITITGERVHSVGVSVYLQSLLDQDLEASAAAVGA
jgi:hypothetical protein